MVAGGGVTLLRSVAPVEELAARLDGDEATGARIVAASLLGPIRQIAENAGLEGGVAAAEPQRALPAVEAQQGVAGGYRVAGGVAGADPLQGGSEVGDAILAPALTLGRG